jgi:hypothetical protein
MQPVRSSSTYRLDAAASQQRRCIVGAEKLNESSVKISEAIEFESETAVW